MLIEGVFDMSQKRMAELVGYKSRCLISVALFPSLVTGKQNSFSLLARAARSSILFFRGLARASSR
jgi:hypothetical protein